MRKWGKVTQKSRVREWFVFVSLAAYLALLIVVTMSPTPIDQGYESAIDRLLAVLHRNGVPNWFGYNKLEFSANVAMFIPIGFLAALAMPSRLWWIALFLCPALSAAIEFTQGALLEARFSTLSDVAANSLGALVGIIGALILRALVHHRDQLVIAEALRTRQFLR